MEAQHLLDRTAKWTEKMYDWSEEQIEEYIDSHGEECNRIVYIEYSYKQIGLTEKWLRRIAAKIGDPLTVRREILLQRLNGSSLSPYPQEDIDYITQCEQLPIDELWINDYFKFDIYENLNKNIPYLVGIDCSTGTNGDNNAITVINPYTVKPVAEFESSYIGETKYEQLIIALVKEHIPRACVIIERNSVGDGIIDHLLSSPISNRLYFDKTLDLVKDKMEQNETVESVLKKNASRKSYYGVYTGTKSREDMFAILGRHVNEFKEKFVTHNVTRDLSRLVRTSSGKIVAGTGKDEDGNDFHDDSIMSYLIAMYVFYHGNNLEVFGITKYDPTESLTTNLKKRADEYDQNLINKEALQAVKEKEQKEAVTKANNWDMIVRNAVAKAQQENYNLYKSGMINNSIYENSNSDVYEFEEEGSIPLTFFTDINK